MKILRPLVALALITTVLTGCSTSNDVVGGVFQKRKYNKGFYMNRGGLKRSDAAEKEQDVAVVNKAEEIRTLDARTVNSIETGQKQLVRSSEAVAVTTSQEPEVVPTTKSRVKKAVTSETIVAVSPVEKTVVREKKGKSVAQILNKKQKSEGARGDDGIFILSVILAILIPPLGVLVYTNIDWVKVLICLLLTILFFLPGMIYALLVVFDVI